MKTTEEWARWCEAQTQPVPSHHRNRPFHDLAAFLRAEAVKHAEIHEDYARQQRVLAKERDRIALERERADRAERENAELRSTAAVAELAVELADVRRENAELLAALEKTRKFLGAFIASMDLREPKPDPDDLPEFRAFHLNIATVLAKHKE